MTTGSSTDRLLDAIERRAGLTPSGLAVAGGAALVWLVGLWLSSRVLFLMAYAIVALLGGLALAGRRTLKVEAARGEMPTRIREGQRVPVALTLSSTRRLTGLILEEAQHALVGRPVRILANLRAGEPSEHTYAIAPSIRGRYEVGPLMAIWTDPFGLTRRRSRVLDPVPLIVHPRVESVQDRVLSREWEDPPIRPPVSKPWPQGFEFYGMREYTPGDDPRRIVWRAVARTGRYLVREAEQGITDRVTLLLDTDADRHGEGTTSETFEAAVRAIASTALHHLDEGFTISIETSEGPLVPGARGRRDNVPVLDALAGVKRGSTTLQQALSRRATDTRRDTHNVIVSPYLDLGSARMLRAILDRGSSITFVHVGGDDSDQISLQRAASIGCEVVELRVGQPLDAVFGRAVGAGLRR